MSGLAIRMLRPLEHANQLTQTSARQPRRPAAASPAVRGVYPAIGPLNPVAALLAASPRDDGCGPRMLRDGHLNPTIFLTLALTLNVTSRVTASGACLQPVYCCST